jgi:hypothetical protein
VARAIHLLDLGVVLGAGIDILDNQRDRRTGGEKLAALGVLEDARENADIVRLPSLGGEARLAGAALVHPVLDLFLGNRNARRTPVDDAADRRPVALAPGGDAEEMAESVERHARFPSRF